MSTNKRLCIGGCIEDTVTGSFDEKTVTHYMTCRRDEFGTFIKDNLLECRSEKLRNIFYEISREPISLYDLFEGMIGPEHNRRMSITTIPTLETLDLIIGIANLTGCHRVEELYCGSGLFAMMLRERNIMLDTKINSIGATDGMYQLEYVESLCRLHIDITRKDIVDYICDDDFNKDCLYLAVNPSDLLDRKSGNDIVNMITLKKPRVFILLKSDAEIAITGYNKYELHPNCIYMTDSQYNILARESELKMLICIRNDLHIDTSIINDYMTVNKITTLTNCRMNIIHQLVCTNILHKFMINVPEKKASEIIDYMCEFKLLHIPLYLDNLDDVETYMTLYRLASNTFGKKPDGIFTKEKFLVMLSYIDKAYSDLPTLINKGIVPRTIADSQTAVSYLLGDYMYASKINTNIYRWYVNN